MNKRAITFGTSGWRAVLAEGFTFENVRIVVRAIAEELVEQGTGGNGVIVTHDTRFLGDRFALTAARVLAGAGLTPLLTNRDTPTPVAAFEVIRRGADGAINFTASHNPPEYQGLKFSPASGGPAPKELTSALERRIAELQRKGAPIPLGAIPDEKFDPRGPYKKRIGELIDLEAIHKSGIRILVNCLYGTSRDYLDALLTEAGCPIEVMNNHPDPLFGGYPPEPAPGYVPDFLDRLESGSFDLGLCTDGDADRFAVFAPNGVSPNANEVLALLLDHLATSRGWKGTVVRTVATSHFVDAVAQKHGCTIVEVPVGFKWIAQEMEKAPEEFVIGGEESGGLTIRGHVPEKDGILATLLAAEMVAVRKEPLASILDRLKKETVDVVSRRVNFPFEPEERDALLARTGDPPSEFAERKILEHITLDGDKYILEDGSWVMFRFSGTEPVIRFYLESTAERADILEAAGRRFLGFA